jgi:plasmid stabilization system protein ParE
MAVTNDDATENPIADDRSTQDDMDALLREYEDAPKEAAPQPESDMSDVVEYIRTQKAQSEAEQSEKDIKSAVDSLKQGLNVKIPDRLLRGAIHDKAAGDQRFITAYQQRHSNPTGWSRVLKGLQQEIINDFADTPDAQATNDRNAVISAVQGSTNKSPEPNSPQNFAKMSDADFDKAVNEAFS